MTTITLPRATVEQALETIESLTRDRLFTAEWAGKHGATIAALRAALAQQTLNAPEECEHKADGWYAVQRVAGVTRVWPMTEAQALRAALAQQAEPVHDRHGACPTHCCPVHGCKYMHDDCPVVSGAVQPVYPRNNGCESCADDALAQQAEGGGNLPPPLQAEPVAAVAENATTQQRVVETPPSDYRRGYWDGFNIGKREGRIEAEDALPQQAEPVEPVAWAGYDLEGMVEAFSRVIEAHHSSKHPFHNPIDMDAKMALRILRGFIPAMKAYAAPPQRKPLTEEEIDECFESVMFNPDIEPTRELIARAIEAAHGIKEGT
jgi:hypothetical protein